MKYYQESIYETLNNNEISLKEKVTVQDGLIGLGTMKQKAVKLCPERMKRDEGEV